MSAKPRRCAIKLSIVIPVYNERETLPIIIDRINKVPVDKEIIIVDDNSNDGTKEYLERLNESHIKTLFHTNNMGKGAAVRTAQAHITGDIVLIQDADLEYQPEDYPVLIKPFEDGYADVVIGSRFLGTHRVFLVWHYFGNKLLTLLTNILFNTILTDMECGYKVFKTEIFKSITIKSNKFNLEPELTAKVFKRKYKIVEVPITYYGRDYNEGKKINWFDAIPAVLALIKYRFVD